MEPSSNQPGQLDASVVIPAIHEAPNLYRLLPQLRSALDELQLRWEILVVDADSSDGTRKVVEDCGARYIQDSGQGYGAAIMQGIQEAAGRYVITMDADLSHPAQFITQLWTQRNDADIVIASRYVPGGHADQPIVRYALSRILNWFFRFGLSISVAKDMSSGFRLYRRSAIAQLKLEFTNFVSLIEILLKGYARGLHIKEVPFHYQPRTSGSSKARIIRFGKDYLRLFFRMWKIRNSVLFPDYDWRAYDSRIPLQRYWQRKRYEIIMRHMPKFVATCDVGCGTSRILADLPHAVGVDMRHDKLAFMRKVNSKLAQADGLQLPFSDESFDCVLCSQVIEHIPEENGRLIEELTRILRPGGTLIIGTPDYGQWQWRVTEKLYGLAAPGAYADEHVTRYTCNSLCSALQSRGYAISGKEHILKGELIVTATKSAP